MTGWRSGTPTLPRATHPACRVGCTLPRAGHPTLPRGLHLAAPLVARASAMGDLTDNPRGKVQATRQGRGPKHRGSVTYTAWVAAPPG
jgi:hypothetical protein